MILIIDFGSQTTHLIGRRIRDMGVGVKIVLPQDALESVQKYLPKGIILSGGPASVYEKNAPLVDKKIFAKGIPTLGICYGCQVIAKQLGGNVVPSNKEYGPANLEVEVNEPLFHNIESYSLVWMSHGDTVTTLPEGFKYLAKTQTVPYAAMVNYEKKIYGIMFHPEVEHTFFGKEILKNFIKRICRVQTKTYNISIPKLIKSIKTEVGSKKVICAVSGGVDSTVAAALIGKAIGKNLFPVYIESGLMRTGTSENVRDFFTKKLNIKPIIIQAEKLFLNKLKGITDPEEKRKIIGKLYIQLFEKEAQKIKNISYLAQGTIYSDVIESKGTKHASKIKSHHNVGGLPETMQLKLLEPLRNFYKDEVRRIGHEIGLPDEMVYMQVFPGPGYAIRIIGEVSKSRLEQIRLADTIILEEIKNAGLYRNIHMSFAIMTNTNSTAVKGDGRAMMEVVALRVIESKDLMTTVWARLPYDLLQKISSRIVNEVPNVSRVVYDITTKPPATMEWE